MQVGSNTRWGHLAERYAGRQPRRILALDGGGIRGLITLEVLVALEDLLASHYHGDSPARDQFRLSQFFDFVGGTSTGAIIAAAIARGMSVREIRDFYASFGRVAFSRRRWYERWKSLYGDGALKAKLMEVFDESADLSPDWLQTLLLVVTRNATTDSAWPVSSNPDARYNDPQRPDCNLRIPLWQLVRASTAAPLYFPPEVVQLDPKDRERAFVFVDGGTTAYNNPAFLMSRMATEPAYRLGWQRGEAELLVVSLGTGSSPTKGTDAEDPETNLGSAAIGSLVAAMGQAQVDQDINCRTVGRCVHGGFLDREIADLVPRDAAGELLPLQQDLGRAFLYCRYDAELTRSGLAAIGINDIDPKDVRKLDSTDHMDALTRIGERVAKQVCAQHLGRFLDLPLWNGGPAV